MKERLRRLICLFLCSILTASPVFADIQDVTTDVGDTTTFQSDGSSAQTGSKNDSNTTANSSGGTSTQYTKAQLTAINAKKGLQSEIQHILADARQEANENGLYSSPNSSIQDVGYQFSTVQIDPGQIDAILNYLDQFNSVKNQDGNNSNYNIISSSDNPVFGNNNLPQLTFDLPEYIDGGDKIGLMDNKGNIKMIVNACDAPSDGMADSYKGSTNLDNNTGDMGSTGSTGSTGNTVDQALFDQAVKALSNKLKLNFQDFSHYADCFQDYNDINYLISFQNKNDPPITIQQGKGEPYSDTVNSLGGVRPDLINGGLNAYYSVTDKFHSFYRFSGTNAMNDYCTVAYIKDYHIENITKNVITNVSQKSNVRRWVVAKDNGAQVVMQTDNPEHQFDFTSVSPGEYTITAYQKVEYTVATQIKYDICEYLFDPVTKGILYFNEKTVKNGTGGTVNMGKTKKEGFVATGDVFRVHVNDLGKVDVSEPSTQRIQ